MKTLLVYFNVDGFAIQLKNHIEDALTELQIEWKECHITDLEQASKDFQPIMHMFFHPNNTIYDYLPLVDSLQGHKLLWQMEDPYESDLTFDMLPHFYYIFTSDENTANQLKKEQGANEIFYVPHAYNPKAHHPMEVTWEYKSDILFVGNAYKSRLEYFRENLPKWKGSLFRLIGVGYRGLEGLGEHHVIHGHISEPEMMKYVNGAKVVLNLHRLNSDLDMHNSRGIVPTSLNNRFYEVAATGTAQEVSGREAPENFQVKGNTYVDRLTKYYLPLLVK